MTYEEERCEGNSIIDHQVLAASIPHQVNSFLTNRHCVPSTLGSRNERSCISYARLAPPPEPNRQKNAHQASRINSETNQVASSEKEDSAKSCKATKERLRKQRSRIHQARHLMKKRKIATDLEDSVKRLLQDIEELRVQHRIAQMGLSTNSTIWNVAAEGVPAQRRFLQASMAPDVIGSTGYGVESLLEDWRLVSLYHEDIDIQLVSLKHGPGNSLIATTEDRVTISINTLRYVFPHLLYGSEGSSIGSRLLGHQFSLRGTIYFRWDEKSGRVVSVKHKGDWLTPMLKLLGSLEDVSQVFCGSVITLDGDLFAREDLRLFTG